MYAYLYYYTDELAIVSWLFWLCVWGTGIACACIIAHKKNRAVFAWGVVTALMMIVALPILICLPVAPDPNKA